MDEALDEWTKKNNSFPVVKNIQKIWDQINIKRIIESDLQFNKPTDIARFKALQCKESNAWLNTIPSKNIGTFIDNNCLRICMALRLACQICIRHTCICGSIVTENGLRGLSCSKNIGKYQRHSEMNNILSRSLNSIHVPTKLEPPGLHRHDKKRPDGITLFPWSRGQILAWDATCYDTFADSYISRTTKMARKAAERATADKHTLYEELKSENYFFVAFAVETMGPWALESLKLANDIGTKLIELCGDKRAKSYLFQKISLAIQRGNAASILGTIQPSQSLNEVFYL